MLDWSSPQRFLPDRFTQGEAIGEDSEHSASVSFEPALRAGDAVDPVAFDVTYVVGERRMHGLDGTTFTARVPLRAQIVVTSAGSWTVSAQCGEHTSTPILNPDDHPVGAFHDRTFFWHTCSIVLERPLTTLGAPITIYGDGQITGPDAANGLGRMTITRAR